MRLFTGDAAHIRYLKVSEGCDHGCAFCAIPLMRGKHRSFALDEVIREAQLLELQGAKELNLVAQDLAHYGRDVRDGNGLLASVAGHARRRGDQAGQCPDCAVGTDLLADRERGVDEDHQSDDRGVGEVCCHEREDEGAEEHDDERVPEGTDHAGHDWWRRR